MKQRGNIYVILALTIAAAGALAGLAWAWNAYTTKLDRLGYERGASETTAQYAARDNAALQAAIQAKDKAEARIAALEDNNAKAVAAASTNYQKGLADGKVTLDAALADVRAGFRLRDPAGSPGLSARCIGDAIGPPSAAASGRDGQAGSELSQAASDFLLRLAGEADEVVIQLTACQQILISDRERQ